MKRRTIVLLNVLLVVLLAAATAGQALQSVSTIYRVDQSLATLGE